jgi:hypothetical protein
MSPATAFNFALLGGALLLLDIKRWAGWKAAQLLALLAGLIALLALIGYTYDIQSLYRLAPFSSMALHTALTFLILALAIFSTYPDRGITALLVYQTGGGLLARRLLPAALLLPLLLGWLCLLSQQAGLYDAGGGLALFALANIVMFTGLIGWNARLLHRADAKRAQAEEQFRLVVEASPNAQLLVSAAGRISMVNLQAEALFGYTRAELLGQPVELLVPAQFRAQHPDLREAFFTTPLARPMGAGRDLFGLRKDGSLVPVEIGLSPLATPAGDFVLASIIDITERKQAEERFHLIVEASPQAIILVTMAGQISMVNIQAETLFGYTRAELLGQPIEILLPPELHADHRTYRNLFLKTPATRAMGIGRDLFGLRKDGSLVPVEIGLNPLATSAGDFVLASIIDITERKQAKEALRESESRLRQLAESLPQLIWTCQPDGLCDFLSPQWVEYTGLPADEQLGFGWLAQLHPDDRQPAITAWNAAVASASDFHVEFRIRRHDGVYRWFDTRAVRLRDAEGRTVKWFGSNTDITERKHAEVGLRQQAEVSRALAEMTHNYQATLDIAAQQLAEDIGDACVIRLVSDDGAWLELTALHHPDPAAAAFIRDVLAADKYQRVDEGLSGRAVQTGQPVLIPIISSEQLKTTIEPKLWALLDRFTIASLLIAPLRAAGRVIGVIVMSRNQPGRPYTEADQALLQDLADRVALALTNARLYQDLQTELAERKRVQEELKQTVVELTRSNAELEQFAYIASHDLQEPLRAVAGPIQLLQQRYAGQLDARAGEFIQHAVEGAGRMQTLINDLLTFSRLGPRGQPFQPTDCAEVLAIVLANLAVAIRESQAAISHDPLPTVMADRTQLLQLFQNLIANAIKFRSNDPPAIHIGVKQQAEEWLFTLADNGIGIEAQYFERIFVIFQRLHTRRDYPGTGIGLALCKKIVERHGGRIWLESQPGRGSTFYFTLPNRK